MTIRTAHNAWKDISDAMHHRGFVSVKAQHPRAIRLGFSSYPTFFHSQFTRLAISTTDIYVHEGGSGPRVWIGDGLSPRDNTVTLDAIICDDRGQGRASAALKLFLEVCDEVGCDVRLEPQVISSVKGRKRTRKQLIAWYARHGFVFEDWYRLIMIRKPVLIGSAHDNHVTLAGHECSHPS